MSELIRKLRAGRLVVDHFVELFLVILGSRNNTAPAGIQLARAGAHHQPAVE